MKQLLRSNALASAVGLALVAAMFQPSSNVEAAPLVASQQAVGAETYIVKFSEDGVLYYQGNVQGLAATGHVPTARAQKLDVHSAAAEAYGNYLATQRATHIAAIESTLGRTLNITHSYSITLNGIAADMTANEAARLATVPGIAEVRRAGFETLATFRGPKFIGADKIWDGTDTPGNVGTRGQGVVVGDLDGGTNSDHPSFANDGDLRLLRRQPQARRGRLLDEQRQTRAPARIRRPIPVSATACTRRARPPATRSTTPRRRAPALPDGVTMSGVAPCAAIHRTRSARPRSARAPRSSPASRMRSRIRSTSSTSRSRAAPSPWNDNDRNFLDMINAGIFVAAAAGNLQTRRDRSDQQGQSPRPVDDDGRRVDAGRGAEPDPQCRRPRHAAGRNHRDPADAGQHDGRRADACRQPDQVVSGEPRRLYRSRRLPVRHVHGRDRGRAPRRHRDRRHRVLVRPRKSPTRRTPARSWSSSRTTRSGTIAMDTTGAAELPALQHRSGARRCADHVRRCQRGDRDGRHDAVRHRRYPGRRARELQLSRPDARSVRRRNQARYHRARRQHLRRGRRSGRQLRPHERHVDGDAAHRRARRR